MKITIEGQTWDLRDEDLDVIIEFENGHKLQFYRQEPNCLSILGLENEEIDDYPELWVSGTSSHYIHIMTHDSRDNASNQT
jgi:hypothetical protein